MECSFISCDWGTSSLRLGFVERGKLNGFVVRTDQGNRNVYNLFSAQKYNTECRESFYLRILEKGVSQLEEGVGKRLKGVPLIISGMASSRIGIRELRYSSVPFSLSGAGLVSDELSDISSGSRRYLLLSGVRSADDVMRGEEVQVIGANHLLENGISNGLVILPGTHSKHVRVMNGEVTGFRTFMTGEFFDLLAHQSLLAQSVGDGLGCSPDEATAAFASGVRCSFEMSLVAGVFSVRACDLLGTKTPDQNFHYLSGLVIGSELRDLAFSKSKTVTLVCSDDLISKYTRAFQASGLKMEVLSQDASDVVVAGQMAIGQRSAFLC